ncbi:hypothetical protein [Pseudomonas sp. NFPP07]|uniref:hypothetical protein n=1 Tax=Pseudomonas sp. NFPP07 TaxID=1566213 RepID=UPI000B850FAE|nr:hypothetical protein [Pseudomonas sp. NFPP07]
MSSRYAVVLGPGSILPDRGFLISQAWGDVPVSYVQDHEIFNECRFLDLKINKWELNSRWSNKQDSEPWIRIEILKGQVLEEYLQNEGCPLSVEVARETLMIFDLDEGGSAVDDMLLLRLVSVFYDRFRVYKWSDRIEEMSANSIASLPARDTIRERLVKCE